MESALSIQARVPVTCCIIFTSIMMTYRPAGQDMLHCSAEWQSAPLFTLGKHPCFTKVILRQSETFFCYTLWYFLKTINTLHTLTAVNECLIFASYSRGSDWEKRLWNQLSWLRQALYCYRWSWFEARSKNMLGGETCKDTWERISLVYYTLVHCERVNFKVIGINFMTVFIARREAACF